MASSRDAIDWERLKPLILQDLADGNTQNQIIQGLAGNPDDTLRVCISKSQLETQLKHWKYRQSLHEPEWKVISHRINKRRKAGKSSQVSVNGFIFNNKKVTKAINRYVTPTLIDLNRQPSPKIPPELSHHHIEVCTPPRSHRSPHLQPSKTTVTQTVQESLNFNLNSPRRIWPLTAQWKKLELSIGQFVDRFFLPKYDRDKWFNEFPNVVQRDSPISRAHRDETASSASPNREDFLLDQAWGLLPGPPGSVSVHQPRPLRSFSGSDIQSAVVETLVGLLYQLSNQSLDGNGCKILESILDAPAFDAVLPHLKDSLAIIDSKILQAIAEGLLKESIDTRNHRMLDLALDVGANTTQYIRYQNLDNRIKGGRVLLYTPLVALCDERTRKWKREPTRVKSFKSPERLILSLLRNNPAVPDSTLLWLIRASCHATAENIIRNQPGRVVNFAISASDLGEDSWLSFNTYHRVSPLLVACSDFRQSPEKLSLISCLLERGAAADLEAVIAAAGACDGKAIALLHQHGAPVNGFIPYRGSPLTSACKGSLYKKGHRGADLTAIHVLLSLGASLDNLEDRGLHDWESSPLHILALAEERPEVTETLELLVEHGADINCRARLYRCVGYWRCAYICVDPGPYGHLAETALEFAIDHSRWITATQLLSAKCELTGREIQFIQTRGYYEDIREEDAQETFRDFIDLLLTKAPAQAAAMHWSGLTVLQRAIQDENGSLTLALFGAGLEPAPLDLLYMLCNRTGDRARVSHLSCGVQMKLVLAAGRFEPVITDMSIVRLILAVACPEVVRYVLKSFPVLYDSEGLCFMIARIVSTDNVEWFFTGNIVDELLSGMNIEDLRVFISRRTISNTHEDWEATAVTMAARAGRSDILQILTGSIAYGVQNPGKIPLFLLKDFLICDPNADAISSMDSEFAGGERNWRWLGIWIKYCEMDDPVMRCSPLTVAATVVPAEAAEEIVDLLLELNYQPDGWTVCVASFQGRLSILERLKQLECWPDILSHKDRPEWCPTALQSAVYGNNIDVVKFLCDEGVMTSSINAPPCRGFFFAIPETSDTSFIRRFLPRTALQHAVDKRNMELVTLLVDAGADINAPAAIDSGATALQIACIQGSIPMVEYLISRGANLHAAGALKHGRMALQGAAEHGRKDTIELLLAQDALISHWHREELVEAFAYAQKNTHHVVASILRERLLSQFDPEGEETLEEPEEGWESSSEDSAFYGWRAEIEAWERVMEDDWPESLRIYEGHPDSDARGAQPLVENPTAFQDGTWLPQDMDFDIGVQGESDVGRIGEEGFDSGTAISMPILQGDIAAWVEGQPSLERYGIDDTLFDGFFFSGFT